MKMIQKIVDNIDAELESAEQYAEEYIYEKSKESSEDAGRYRSYSQQELEHATFLHTKAVKMIEELKKVYTPSQEMLDKWNKEHGKYTDKVARINMMLKM